MVSAAKLLDLLPKKMKIGPHDWYIVITDKMVGGVEGEARYGETEFSAATIRLNPKLISTPAMAISVFLHEIYHAGLFSLGASQPKKEEAQALLNETLYCTVFRDNLWILDWMKKGYK